MGAGSLCAANQHTVYGISMEDKESRSGAAFQRNRGRRRDVRVPRHEA